MFRLNRTTVGYIGYPGPIKPLIRSTGSENLWICRQISLPDRLLIKVRAVHNADIQQRIDLRSAKVHVLVPLADGRTIARMREAGVVLREDVCEDDSKLSMELKVDDAALGNLRRSLPSDVHLEVVEPAAEPREPAGLD